MSSEFSQVGVLNESDARINPATEELQRALNGLIDQEYDTISITYTDATKENISTAEFYVGGTGGTLVNTITITYPTATTEVYTNL